MAHYIAESERSRTHPRCNAGHMYQLPDATRVELDLAPALESWNAADHPDQIRLGEFLDHVEAALALSGRDEHLALELQVGVSESRSLTSGGGDLDNYLFPIIRPRHRTPPGRSHRRLTRQQPVKRAVGASPPRH